MFEHLDELLDGILSAGIPYYDCAVMKNGKCIYRRMNGIKDEKTGERVNGKERYNIYSCSKLITCTAALKLWEKGLFSLEDKLSDYLPEFSRMLVKDGDGVREAENPILIKHLFEMTAGFNYKILPETVRRIKEETGGKGTTRIAVKHFAENVLDFEPGEGWQYSCAHDILAGLVEVLSGMRFGEYVKKNIFDVVGMNNSSFMISESERKELAPQYIFNAETGKAERADNSIISVYNLGNEYEGGGAGCVSTLDDYIKFLEALREGESLLKRDTIRLMATNGLNKTQNEALYRANKCLGYGLGVRCSKSSGSCAESGEFGWGGKAGAYHSIDIKNGLSIFYVQHVISSPPSVTKIRNNLHSVVLKELGIE